MEKPEINEKYFILTLYTIFFTSMIPGIISGLLLIDISQTFNSNIGVVSQIRSVAAALGIIAALFIGVASVRFQAKHLVIIGLVFLGLVGLGSGTASSLAVLFIVYSMQGLGIGFVSPMVNSMMGEFLSPEKRSKAFGYLIAAGSLSFLVSSPVVGFINNNGGWRLAFLYYQLPLVLVALILSFRFLPVSTRKDQRNQSYLEGLGIIRKSRSAVACLIAVMLGSVCWMSFLTFSTSFFRDKLGASVSMASFVMVLTSLAFSLASIFSGSVNRRFSLKNTTVIGTLCLGVFTVLYTFSPSFSLGVGLVTIGSIFNGFRIPSANGLAIEQVPEYRGVMMSLNSAFVNVGNFLGTFIGGFVLIEYGWSALGVVLGFFGIFASAIYWLFTVD
jgi:DHA1 family inner membrane transport protein